MKKNKSVSEIKKLIDDRSSAQKYLDIAEVIFLLLDSNGMVSLINKKGCKLLGYDSKKIVGKNWFNNFLPPSGRDEVKAVFDQILRGEIHEVEYFENKILTSSGKQRLIAWHNSKLVDSEDRIIGTLSSGIDVTNQRLAEKKFKQVVESSPNGIIMTNSKGEIELVNRQTEDLFGYKRTELIGKSIEILVPRQMRNKHKGYRKEFFSYPASRPMGRGRDLYALRKDQSIFPVEIGLSTIETEGGTAVLSSIVDITERKKSEAILKDSEEKLQAVLDNISDAILVYSENGKIMMINNKAKSLFSNKRKKLKNISEIISSNQISVHDYQLRMARNGQSLSEYETERTLANGKRILVSIALSYMPSEDGLYIETIRDITERVLMRNKILDFEKAQIIANMAEGIAHHMGTPLASMLLRIQMLKEDIDQHYDDPSLSDKMHFVEKQILYCQKVMQRLLRFANKPSNEKQPTNILNITNDSVEIIRPLLSKKRIEMVIDIDKMHLVLADGNLIQLVLSDLIINSIQSIEDKGTIKIAASIDESSDNITISLSDTGSGIPEDVIPYVFEPFYTTKTAERGTGLGLAVAKRIIQEHDGEIRIESKVDKGTDIIIKLPLLKGEKLN